MNKDTAQLAVILALSAKPHKDTLHKSTNNVRNALEDAAKLVKCANAITRQCVNMCNGIPKTYSQARREWDMGWDEADQDKADKIIERNQKKLREIASDYQLDKSLPANERIEFQRDPRGCCVKVRFAAGYWSA